MQRVWGVLHARNEEIQSAGCSPLLAPMERIWSGLSEKGKESWFFFRVLGGGSFQEYLQAKKCPLSINDPLWRESRVSVSPVPRMQCFKNTCDSQLCGADVVPQFTCSPLGYRFLLCLSGHNSRTTTQRPDQPAGGHRTNRLIWNTDTLSTLQDIHIHRCPNSPLPSIATDFVKAHVSC